MLYSSVPEEDRRRKNEIEEERKDAGFERIQDVTHTHDNMDGTLGATQTLNDIGAFDDDILLKGKGIGSKKDNGVKYKHLRQETTGENATVEVMANQMGLDTDEMGMIKISPKDGMG
jgi:hypothetical protein